MEAIKRTKIVDVLKSEAFGTTVNVKGWVRTRRGSKQVSFIALNDGSTINNVQIVVDVDKLGEEFLKPITTGASISVNGTLVQSQGKGQNVEIQTLGQLDDEVNDLCMAFAVGGGHEEIPVQLQQVDGHLCHHGQGGFPGAEVVHFNEKSRFPKLGKYVENMLRIMDIGPLRHFQVQRCGAQLIFLQ